MFDAPNLLSCGTNSALGELRIKASDDYGNKSTASFEVPATLEDVTLAISSADKLINS